jgi:hypothetical protein
MTNDEARKNDETQMIKKNLGVLLRHLGISASFVIRHSGFVIVSTFYFRLVGSSESCG